MILKFNKKDFLSALKHGSSCAGINVTTPILDNIRMRNDGEGHVKIMSSSLDVTVERRCKTEEPVGQFDVCIPAKDLMSAVSRLSDFVFSIEIEEERIQVVYGGGSITLPTIPPHQYPNIGIETQEASVCFNLNASTVAYILDTCKNFLSNDELRPNMMCVNFDIDGSGNLEYCATDAHKLVTEKIAGIQPTGVSTTFMLPKRIMTTLRSLCEEADRPLSVNVFDSKVSFVCEDWSVIGTKTEGKYPNYHTITAGVENNDKMFTVNKNNLSAAVARMLSVANETTNMIRLECNDSGVRLYSEDADLGKTATEKLSVSSNNCEQITIGFNGVFIKTCLDLVDDENVTITASTPQRAATFIDNKHPGKIILAMPVMLKN